MTSEPSTWAAELDLGDIPDDHFLKQQQVRPIAGDGQGENDEFDGFDSNWYWDNDFDCLSVSDDSPTEMISVVLCSDDEMGAVVYRDDNLEDVNRVALPLLEASETNRDLSNEVYLKHFEQKISQATDFGYNISSVSSSLSSSSDSSLHLVMPTEVNPEFWLKQEKRRLDGNERPQLTTQSSSLAAAAAAAAADENLFSAENGIRIGFDSCGCSKSEDAVDRALAALDCQHKTSSELLHGIAQTAKDKTEQKRKVRKKTSKVSTFSKTEKSPCRVKSESNQSQGFNRNTSVELRTRTDSSFHPGYSSNHSTGNKVLAVYGFSTVLGIFSGLLLGFLTSQHFTSSMNVGEDRMPEFSCPRSVCQSGHQMTLNSVWSNKYEELVMENAQLRLKLQQLKQKFLFELLQAQHMVSNMRREVGEIREHFGKLQTFSESECHSYANDNMLPPHGSLFSALSSLAIPQSESVCTILVPQSEKLEALH